MDINKVCVDPIHFFDNENFTANPIFMEDPQNIYFIAEQKDDHQLFYLVKKGEKYQPKKKNSFIDYLEKSTELIHPSIINLSGYSIDKPYLYYKYSYKPLFINDIKLTDENVQKILTGIASALSYLSSKGYYFQNISFNSIIFDHLCLPKIFDYIDFENKNKCTERDMVIKYVELMQFVLNNKIDEDPTIPINDELNSLIGKFQDKQEKNLPTFDDFLVFFKNNSFRGNEAIYRLPPVQRSFQILDLQDILIFDDFISKKIDKYRDFDSIEQIVYYFLRKTKLKKIADKKSEMLEKKLTQELSEEQMKKIMEKQKSLKFKHLYLLNSLPEYYIKPLNLICEPLCNKLIRYLYNENISLIIPNWKDICKKDYFTIYKYLMKQKKKLEKQKNEIFCFDEKAKKLNYEIEAIRIKAIEFLNKESEQSYEGKIELAVQYIKNDILPINYDKSLKILNSMSNANMQTKAIINQMKAKINAIQSKSIDDIIQNLPEIQQKIYKDAKEGKNVLSMLYVAFALYTGFNGFPIIRSLSIQYYEEAAKLSPDAMTLLGFLQFNGIFFPQNIKEAQKCFRCAADNGSLKGEIIDGILRHVWRSYLVKFEINDLFENYLQSFESMIPNDSYVFPKINYFIDSNIESDHLFEVKLSKADKSITSDEHNKNQRMFLECQKTLGWEKKIKQFFSAKVSQNFSNLSSPSEESTDEKDLLCNAKSYFYGDNNFPVNYEKAKHLFKLAADKGDSEAQWRYALSVINFNDSDYDKEVVNHYLQESANQNNIRGKLYYAIFVKQIEKNNELFEKIIEECCKTNNPDAMYYYGMYLEDYDLNKSIQYYKNAADLGHFNSLIRLIQLLRDQITKEQNKKENEFEEEDNDGKAKEENKKQKNDDENEVEEEDNDGKAKEENKKQKNDDENEVEEEEDNDGKAKEEEKQVSLYNYYFELSAGIFNEDLISDLIIFYDEKQQYEQSNALIQIGILINHFRFNIFYIDHLMYGKGMDININRAKNLVLFAHQNQNQISKYKEKYNYLLLQTLAATNEHQKACKFLFKIKDELNENKEEFQIFYKKFDKNLARRYYIPACFYNKQFIECHNKLIKLLTKNTSMVHVFGEFVNYVDSEENPFAMALLGKIYKEGKYFIVIRSLRKAIKYFSKSADKNCPLGCYYLGKEFYYGRYLAQNFEKARDLLSKAIENNQEPRAGYYLYKIMKKDEALKNLKIGADFECKRALFGYGKYLYKNGNKDEGQALIIKAVNLNYKKAKIFCIKNGISFEEAEKKSDLTINEDDSAKISENFYNSQEVNKFDLVYIDESNINNESYVLTMIDKANSRKIKLNEKKNRIEDDDDYSISSEVENNNDSNLINA